MTISGLKEADESCRFSHIECTVLGIDRLIFLTVLVPMDVISHVFYANFAIA